MDSLYGQSVWTKLAKNRLVELKVLGKIEVGTHAPSRRVPEREGGEKLGAAD